MQQERSCKGCSLKDDAAGLFKGCSLEALQNDEEDAEEEACKGFQGCSLKDDAAGFFKGFKGNKKALKQVQALQAYKIKR